jgi:hypothetical protein
MDVRAPRTGQAGGQLAKSRALLSAFYVTVLLATVAANTTDLSHAGSRDAVTWDFALVWRRRGTPGRRLGV